MEVKTDMHEGNRAEGLALSGDHIQVVFGNFRCTMIIPSCERFIVKVKYNHDFKNVIKCKSPPENNPGHTVLLTDPDNFKYMSRCKILEFKMYTIFNSGPWIVLERDLHLCYLAGVYFTQTMKSSHGGISKNNCLVEKLMLLSIVPKCNYAAT